MKAVSDSTPLIHLSKIGCLELLKKFFKEIIISEGVFKEVVVEGKNREKHDFFPVQKLIDERFIHIRRPRSIINIENLDQGEKESISLCKEHAINTILIDEKVGFSISSVFNLIPIRTTSLLMIFLDKKIISLSRYKELLIKLRETGYFLDFLTYERLLSIGERISKNS